MIEAFGLKKYFSASSGFAIGASGWVRALDDVSVKVGAGETLGIVGESGSGKTTLAKIILLLERPTAGSLRFDGKDVASFTRDDLARYRRSVQAVFQDPYSSLNPRMRVEHIVAEPLFFFNDTTPTEKSDRVREVLQLV